MALGGLKQERYQRVLKHNCNFDRMLAYHLLVCVALRLIMVFKVVKGVQVVQVVQVFKVFKVVKVIKVFKVFRMEDGRVVWDNSYNFVLNIISFQ